MNALKVKIPNVSIKSYIKPISCAKNLLVFFKGSMILCEVSLFVKTKPAHTAKTPSIFRAPRWELLRNFPMNQEFGVRGERRKRELADGFSDFSFTEMSIRRNPNRRSQEHEKKKGGGSGGGR